MMNTETKPTLNGLPRILAELSAIAHGKAEHVETNWQDKQLSGAWTRIAGKLAALAKGAR